MGSTSDRRDPKPDVVTGYPAVHPASGGGTAYPYPAPPPNAAPYYAPNPNPNPNGYYPNPNPNYNGYYQNPNPRYNRNSFLRRLFAVVAAAFIIVGAITFIVWLVLRPRFPEFAVSSFEVSKFSLSSNSLTSDFSVALTVRNPNKKMSIDYDQVGAAVLYSDEDVIAQTSLSPFYQSTGDVRDLKARFAAVGVYTDDDTVNAIRSEQSKGDGAVTFGVRFISVVKFKAGAWRTRRHYLRVYCDGIRVGLKNATAGAGSMVGPAKACQVWM